MIQDKKLGSQYLGPGTQDPRLRTQDSRLQNLGPGDLNFFIELQNKTLKSKKSLKGKRENTKYPFTYFSLTKIVGFFLWS